MCVAALAVVIANCGAPLPPAAPSAEPQREEEAGSEAERAPAEEKYIEQAPPAAAPPPPTGGAADRALSPPPSATPTLSESWMALEQAAAELQTAGNDCGTACRALGSMKRAKDNICAITGADDARCERAVDQVTVAARRVRAACGECE